MPGIAKFESILEEVGLAGTVEEATKDQLYELSKVRNVLVHRAGVVDRKLLDECPWLDYEVGDQIRIDHDKYSTYSNAVQEYVLALINRIRVVHDIPEYVPPTEDSRSEP